MPAVPAADRVSCSFRPEGSEPCPALVAALEALALFRQAQREAVEIDVSYGGTAADDQEDRCLGGCGSRVLPEHTPDRYAAGEVPLVLLGASEIPAESEETVYVGRFAKGQLWLRPKEEG